MKKLLSMALALMMVLTLLAVPAMAADSINITEVNDYGTVTAEVDSTTITVVAETGYYLYSATLNGADILANMTVGYDDIRDSAVCPKEQWTYTLTEGTLTAADELVVAYGYYSTDDIVAGGDANTALGTAGAWASYSAGNVEIVAEPGNTSNNVFLYHGGRLKNTTTWDWLVGEKYLIKYDAKVVNYDPEAKTSVRFYGDSTTVCPNGRKYTLPAGTADWKTYITYMDVVTKDKDYIFFQVEAATDVYFDNISVQRLTKAGIVPVYCDVNVTENADNGTVTVAERAVQGEALDIKIVADTGYYVDSVTVDGTPVVLTEGYEKTATTTVYAYNEAYTYTIDAVAADVEIVVTYAAYNAEELVIGGNGEEAVTNVQADEVATTAVEVPGENGNKAFVATSSGKIGIPRWNLVEGERYLISWDAKAVSGTPVCYVYATGIGYLPNGVDGDGREYASINVDGWKSFTTILTVNPGKFDTPVLYPNNNSAYIDNFSIKRITKGAVTPEPPAPTTAAVTITGENAVVSVAADTVAIGEATTFTAKPKFGYYIESITIGGVDFNGFDAYKGGTYGTGEITADTEIVVTTASYAANDKGVATEVATLPSVFAPAADTAVTFGKVLDTTDATSWGIELTKDGVGVTPYHGGSYLYKALATNANGQYAIEFIGLEAGEYQIRSYVYVNGTPVFGAPSTFVVD